MITDMNIINMTDLNIMNNYTQFQKNSYRNLNAFEIFKNFILDWLKLDKKV
jgi:hypothetical protein